MSIIAIPVFDDRVCSRIDCMQNVLLISVENGAVRKQELLRVPEASPLGKMKMLAELSVDVVICGGITDMCATRLREERMQVIPWIRGNVAEVLESYLQGRLANVNTAGAAPKSSCTSQGIRSEQDESTQKGIQE